MIPDYVGKLNDETRDHAKHTVYPFDLAYANYSGNPDDLLKVEKTVEETCWFQWTYVALYSLEFLKQDESIDKIGVMGIRIGGDIAWEVMLSDGITCGIPINAVGWRSYQQTDKFVTAERHMSDERHSFIAGLEAESYAPFVKCPVLMLCSMHDRTSDYDRAYDTFSRIGVKEDSKIVYSPDSSSGIGPDALLNMSLFLGKHLFGREIYIPTELDVKLGLVNGSTVSVNAQADIYGLIEDVGVWYAETDEDTPSTSREWKLAYTANGNTVKNGAFSTEITPYNGASLVFVYAYVRYINGFKTSSKVAMIKMPQAENPERKERKLYPAKEEDVFDRRGCTNELIGGIFMEHPAKVELVEGYGKILGAYAPNGIETCRVASPKYKADKNAYLHFEVWSEETMVISVIAYTSKGLFTYEQEVKGMGKWKRFAISPNEMKNVNDKSPLSTFVDCNVLAFESKTPDVKYAVTNLLWL